MRRGIKGAVVKWEGSEVNRWRERERERLIDLVTYIKRNYNILILRSVS